MEKGQYQIGLFYLLSYKKLRMLVHAARVLRFKAVTQHYDFGQEENHLAVRDVVWRLFCMSEIRKNGIAVGYTVIY